MPLVDPLPADHGPEVERLAAFFAGTLGFAPNSVLTVMRRPAIARAFTELNRAVMEKHGRVTGELERLIGHVASTAAGCRYCQAHTIRGAARFGHLNRWNDAMATELEPPAAADGDRWLAARGWSAGKHGR